MAGDCLGSYTEQYLKQIEGNLKLVQEAACPGDGMSTTAKAKLVKVRLDQAVRYVLLDLCGFLEVAGAASV